MRFALRGEEVPDAGGDRSHHGILDPGAVFRVEDAECDDGKAGCREDEREEERILEDLPRQVPYVSEHACGTENHEHPTLQQYGEQYEAGVDEAVDQPVHLAPSLEQGKPAPEGEHPEEVAPERVVLLCESIHQVRSYEHDEPEDERNHLETLRLVVVPAVDERGEVHGHEPQRERDGGREEREPEEPQGEEASTYRSGLHREPSALYVVVEIRVIAGCPLQPQPRHPLEAVNGQRRHAHGRRNEESSRYFKAPVPPQQAAGDHEAERIGERDRK